MLSGYPLSCPPYADFINLWLELKNSTHQLRGKFKQSRGKFEQRPKCRKTDGKKAREFKMSYHLHFHLNVPVLAAYNTIYMMNNTSEETDKSEC